MTKKEFNGEILRAFVNVSLQVAGTRLERVNTWMGQTIHNVFTYAAISEHVMEKQLRELKGAERKTTFMADLSRGEWLGYRALLDTIKLAMKSWRDDEEYMAEFVLCVNWKAWEHEARGNHGWATVYSRLYDAISSLMYRYYENDKKKTAYLYTYLD